VVSVHFNKTLFLESKGSHGKKNYEKKKKKKKLNLDPSSEVHRVSSFVSLLKLSLHFRAMHLHI